MANWRKVGSGKFKYVKYADCEEGQVLAEGRYLGTKEGQYGIQHHIQEDGEVAVLNSSGHLNWLLENEVKRNDLVRVTYAGMEKLEKGKFKNKEAHRFELEVAEDNKGGSDKHENASSESEEDSEGSDDSGSRKSSLRSGGLGNRSSSSSSTSNGRGNPVLGVRSKSSRDEESEGEDGDGSDEDSETEEQEEKQKEEKSSEKTPEEKEKILAKYRTRK